ncbi:MAG: response regulator [Pelotomaculum sp.]|uniref:Stage 0 sporulation protein A homolog n=1 Tax=Pelotomaculum thermopropionicum (strain DSM 13744 / JCM 10971 / SI) TaxID=370438 RepID=A5CY97_PELTS|nr:response regulator [Pelotomaculum sp.]BAF61021.1 FOG: CheY-like receiver [Pelotomaculum thermopropionicum SI]
MAGEVYDLLIVDDQAGVRHLLCEAFKGEGYRVELASSGSEAIKKVKTRIPSLILLDIKMPGMNGLETLEELRKIAPDTPVVIMTAYGELDIIAEAKKRGVQHYISKPFDLDDARYLIRGLLEEEKAEREMLKEIG